MTTEQGVPPRPPRSWDNPKRHFSEAISHPWYKAVFGVTTALYWSIHDFFHREEFDPAPAPITTGAISSPTEPASDSLPVSISLFGQTTYLADSMQFHLEYLLRHAQHGVFYIMPSFRGEQPDERHLNQFFHVEAEMVGDLPSVMHLVNRLLITCASDLMDGHGALVHLVAGRSSHLERLLSLGVTGIPILTFEECTRCIGDTEDFYVWHDDRPVRLSTAGEKCVLRRSGEAVWVTNFPSCGVPFYQAIDAESGLALCADLLLGTGETVGAGQRHVSADELLAELVRRDLDPAPYDWYLRLKREYPLQSSGFGLGLERLLLWVLAHDDIRDIPTIVRMRGLPEAP